MLRKRMLSILFVILLVLSFSGCMKEIPIDDTTVITDKKTNENTAKDATTKDATTKDTPDSSQNTQPEDTDLVPEEGAKLTYWTGDVEFGEAVAKKFEEKYGVPVSVEEVGLGAIDKIALSGPAGTGADVFMSPHDSFQHGVASGLFLELEEPVVANIKRTC
jgi:arabinogalactan oligomer/maltooligosaccharide transport system substrate-binding protein